MKKIKSICLSFTFLLFVPTLVAQTTIKGSVMGSSGKPISKASVFLPETYEGAETDAKGSFSFTTDEKGVVLVVANSINHIADTLRVEIKDNQSLPEKLYFTLTRQISVLLDEIQVSSVSSMGVSEAKSKKVLSTMDVYTTPAANADLAIALRSTPGLQDVGTQAGFFVRGGADNETGVVIDGVRVKNFFKKEAPNIASRSRIDAGMFKGMILGIGGYSTQYGDALSGMMELNTNDMPSESSVGIGFSPFFASIGTSLFGLKRKTYTELAYSYTNLYAIQPLFRRGWSLDPLGDSHALKMRNISKLSEKGELRFTLFADYSDGGVNKKSLHNDGSDFRFQNRETYLLSTVNYKQYLGTSMTLTFIGGYSRNENKSQYKKEEISSALNTHTVDEYGQLGVNLKYQRGRFSSLQGLEYSVSKLGWGDLRFSDANSAAFFNAMQQIYDSWLLTAGLRAEYSELLKNAVLLPRLSLTHSFTKNSSLTLDAGSYSQVANYFFPTQYSQGGYSPSGRERSEQYNLTYQFLPQDAANIVRIQLFNKQYRKLSQIRDEHIINEGKGYARGLDLFFMSARPRQFFKYRLAYSFIDSKREFLYYPVMAQPRFVANHTASVVVQKFVPKISAQFNLSLSFNSGFPYYNPNLDLEKFMSERTPVRFDMGISYNKLFVWGKANGVAVFSVTNMLGTYNVLDYQFSKTLNSEGKYTRQAISSPTYPFLFMGVFLNIGTDKRQEIIDKYL